MSEPMLNRIMSGSNQPTGRSTNAKKYDAGTNKNISLGRDCGLTMTPTTVARPKERLINGTITLFREPGSINIPVTSTRHTVTVDMQTDIPTTRNDKIPAPKT